MTQIDQVALSKAFDAVLSQGYGGKIFIDFLQAYLTAAKPQLPSDDDLVILAQNAMRYGIKDSRHENAKLMVAALKPYLQDKPQIRGDAAFRDGHGNIVKHSDIYDACPSCQAKEEDLNILRQRMAEDKSNFEVQPLSDTGMSDEMRGKLVEGIADRIVCLSKSGRASEWRELPVEEVAEISFQRIEQHYTLIPKGNL